ncbi:MAG: fused MFS/spermidine synthase [Arenimonas sp.]
MFSFKRSTTLLFLFAFSGVSGLIYQSVWSHYLGLTLGHAAYAQTLVLAIFMGAMAAGAWLASKKSSQWKNPVAAYAVIEGVIGLFGILFHTIFVNYSSVSQESILPELSQSSAHLYQWITAALLIFPQCLLLGMTFPLLSAGFIRANKQQDGQALGGLYFSNSLGAAIGALLATFLLLPEIGMPGAMTVAGVLNIVVAVGAWLASRQQTENVSSVEPTIDVAPQPKENPEINFGLMMCIAAGITGATSFAYEIVWVRMLNQALGTTLHSFELMLASFILGLAFGGLWISRNSDRIGDAVRYAGLAQVGMGLAALASSLVFANSFVWVGWLTNTLSHDAQGYTLYNLGSAAIALLVMFPAAFFAGMTLPLFTMALLRTGHGESSIGRIYAANTAGAILGVLLTVHVLVPAIGLNLSLALAAAADVGLGLFLLRFVWAGPSGRLPAFCGVAGLIALVIALQFGKPDPIAQVSGTFRTGKLLDPKNVTVAYLEDGKTSTISVLHYVNAGAASIVTNGKPDASLTLTLEQAPLPDEVTMVMAGSLPLAVHPDPKTVGIIGWGSGLTTHTILGSEQITRVDNVEIEPAMHEGARLFGERVSRGYTDPRSRLIIEDARTYFATGGKKYDIIISEPSNPWVSGVASLFTDEFYIFLEKHLEERGVLAQWIQSYELSDELLAKMVSALLKTFPNVEVYLTNDFELIFLASKSPIPSVDYSKLKAAAFAQELPRLGLGAEEGFRLRRIGSANVLRNYVKLMGANGNSDYHPVLALESPKSRFMQDTATFLQTLADNGLPLLDMLDGREPVKCQTDMMLLDSSRYQRKHFLACALVSGMNQKSLQVPQNKDVTPDVENKMMIALKQSSSTIAGEKIMEWSAGISELAKLTIGALPQNDLEGSWINPKWIGENQSPLVTDIMLAYQATAKRDQVAMKTFALKVLDSEKQTISGNMREQMLVIAMLGAASQKQFQEVRDIDSKYGSNFTPSQDMTMVRIFLLAWADKTSPL